MRVTEVKHYLSEYDNPYREVQTAQSIITRYFFYEFQGM